MTGKKEQPCLSTSVILIKVSHQNKTKTKKCPHRNPFPMGSWWGRGGSDCILYGGMSSPMSYGCTPTVCCVLEHAHPSFMLRGPLPPPRVLPNCNCVCPGKKKKEEKREGTFASHSSKWLKGYWFPWDVATSPKQIASKTHATEMYLILTTNGRRNGEIILKHKEHNTTVWSGRGVWFLG